MPTTPLVPAAQPATDRPKISVVLVVYNHAPYLAKSLAGIEMQEFDGEIEVVIHDDASTDASADICQNYQNNSRHTVKIIRQPINKYSRGISFWPEIMSACTGQFIATCEGDDYWIAPNKLQNQHLVLQTLPDVDSCFHRVHGIHWETEGILRQYGDYGEEPQRFSTEAVIEGDGGFMPSPSLFFRRTVLDSLPSWFFGPISIADYYLQVFSAQRGGSVYLPMIGAAYRTGDPRAWSQQVTRSVESINQFDLEFLSTLVKLKHSLADRLAVSVNKIFMRRYVSLAGRCLNELDMVTLKKAAVVLLMND